MYTYRAKVNRVVDGDTFDVTIDLGFGAFLKQRLRLARVDTPEVRGEERPEGLKAKEFVELWFGKWDGEIIVKTTKERGKYGRYIAEVASPEDENLSDLLLAEGLAEEYKG